MTTFLSLCSSEFFLLALLAGSLVGIVCGLVGTVLVLRGELFSADALSHVAFTGALAAFLLGFSTGVGLVASCVVFSIGLEQLHRRTTSADSVIGTTFAWILGVGTLLLSLSAAQGNSASGSTSTAVLFGSLFTISPSTVVFTVICGIFVIVAMIILGRPLIFSSIDRPVAIAKGVRVEVLAYGFASLVGLAAALAVQSVGALLFVGLLAAPAGAALKLTRSPFAAMAASVAISVTCVVVGSLIAGLSPSVPPSAAITVLAACIYGAVALATRAKGHRHGH